MKLISLLLSISLLLTACSRTYYVVRHAEKAAPGPDMSTDVPLTPAGEQRALTLRDSLKDKRIGYIFSTNTVRTKSTAAPLATVLVLPTTIYGPKPDSSFIQQLFKLKKNALIVGHSNTVDDIVNGLCMGKYEIKDLAETEYDKLFVVKVTKKWGKRVSRLRRTTYGVSSH
jgi:broad specificity phosphatase PhoE